MRINLFLEFVGLDLGFEILDSSTFLRVAVKTYICKCVGHTNSQLQAREKESHIFGARLSDSDRRNLIEIIKSTIQIQKFLDQTNPTCFTSVMILVSWNLKVTNR